MTLLQRPLVSRLWITLFSACLLAAIAPGAVWSQFPPHVWSVNYGDVDSDWGLAVTTDGDGNVFVTGLFLGTVDFGSWPLTSAGLRDIVVAKYDANGEHIWSRRFGGTGNDWGAAIAVDAGRSVLVTGRFEGTVDFGGGPLTAAGLSDIFLLKMDPNGNPIWSRRFGDTSFDAGGGVAVDAVGNVIVTGSFRNTVDFGGGPLAGAGDHDIFIAKFDPDGAHLWSRRAGDTFRDVGTAVAADGSGGVFVTGWFWHSADFGGGTLTGAGNSDIFVAAYDADGNHRWSRSAGGTVRDEGRALAIDGAGNVIVTGEFHSTADFGGGPFVSAGRADVFVAKYDAGGAHLWSRRFGDPAEDVGFAIATDPADDVILTGWFWSTIDFGGGPFTAVGEWDIFVTKLDAGGGAHLWSQSFGGDGWEAGYGVAVDPAGGVVVTGAFEATVDFGGGPLTTAGGGAPPDGAGDEDIFIAKYADVPVAIADDEPAVFADRLEQNYPNPFNPATRIAFSLDRDAPVTLSVHDATGRLVKTLIARPMSAGVHEAEWDGRDAGGERVASGVYFYRLTAGNRTLTRKAALLK